MSLNYPFKDAASLHWRLEKNQTMVWFYCNFTEMWQNICDWASGTRNMWQYVASTCILRPGRKGLWNKVRIEKERCELERIYGYD